MRLALSLTLILSCGLALAGSLNPPGPPAPTMKPLDQVEARTPISSLPFTISTAGSYYLTKNLTLASGDGIAVFASFTTIDLNGFTLDGGGGTTGYGIHVFGSAEAITLRNGTISHWIDGIHGNTGESVQLDGVTVRSCVNNGVFVTDASVRDCNFLFNGADGVFIGGVGSISDSRAGGNGGTGMNLSGPRGLIVNCTIDGNGGSGVLLGQSGMIRTSIISNNVGIGIDSGNNTFVVKNNLYNNYVGIALSSNSGGGCRIEGNTLADDANFDVEVHTNYNAIIKNSFHTNGFAFFVSGVGNLRPLQSPSQIPTNPWLNLFCCY